MDTTSGGYKIKDQEGIYFLTVTTVGWIDVFTRKRYRDIFIESLKFCQEQKGLIIYAFVIMSNHVHMIVRCIDKRGLSFTIGDLKQFTANKIIKSIKKEPESRQDWLEVVMKFHAKYNNNNRNYQLWQQDNHPIYLYSPDVTFQKLNYIHENPVRAGWVAEPSHYLYSSASNYTSGEGLMNVMLLDFPISTVGYIHISH